MGDSVDRCPGQIEVPTGKERQALEALKAIKERVRALKKTLSSLSESGPHGQLRDIEALKEELARLKAEWNEWQEKRVEAEKERMILLGHETAGER